MSENESSSGSSDSKFEHLEIENQCVDTKQKFIPVHFYESLSSAECSNQLAVQKSIYIKTCLLFNKMFVINRKSTQVILTTISLTLVSLAIGFYVGANISSVFDVILIFIIAINECCSKFLRFIGLKYNQAMFMIEGIKANVCSLLFTVGVIFSESGHLGPFPSVRFLFTFSASKLSLRDVRSSPSSPLCCS
ncbi:hypothetical protein RF11_05891 [Thelohanellus kitauei]|uniref:Uncharacterized protein n=1 Tax=Thelohanellus kitauei TaxID=669202 RepID=A0A0C2IJE9_THEKT|nr:hypothetical protein RF11_11130 [Thelohanellus kitauei]KII66727.1 hypothetical protein RF11_05891 [Thelohanellus kitauei]